MNQPVNRGHRPPSVLLAVLLFALVPGAATAQNEIVGSWRGTLEIPGANMQLPVIFHIRKIDGSLTATLDSPSQGATPPSLAGAQMEFEATSMLANNGKQLDAMQHAWHNVPALYESMAPGGGSIRIASFRGLRPGTWSGGVKFMARLGRFGWIG